jgi:tryptophan-rich sensory protein
MGSLFPPGTWYEGLQKPTWTPPDVAFPIAWTLLYLMIAAAGWRLWRAAGSGRALGSWFAQLLLNATWTPVVFGAHALGVGLLVILLLWVAILVTILAASRVDRPAALLLVPYLIWVSYATALNTALWRANG